MSHYSPKQRVNVIEPRAQLYSWPAPVTNYFVPNPMFYRVEIAGEPITCAWKSAREAWAAALRALSSKTGQTGKATP